MKRCTSHDVTLIAWHIDEDGMKSIVDIVETSYHFAYHFTRKWVKMSEISFFTAEKPLQRL